jgi:ABC-2 type transport system permease protein
MSTSKAITEKHEGQAQPPGWHPPREQAPSTIVAVQPLWPRIAGSIGLVFVVLGGVTLFLYALHPNEGRLISPGWARILAVLGIGGIMYHALVDAETQVRRLYQFLGYALIILGIFMSWIPFDDVHGAKLLPWGVFGYIFGLVMLLAFLRHETEKQLRDYAVHSIGIVGAALALVGFAFSTFGPTGRTEAFLFSHGLMFALLGLIFGTTFVRLRPASDQLAYWGGIGMGITGAVFFLIAAYRSIFVEDYAMPAGLLLSGMGLLYMAVSVGLFSEVPIVVLTRRELTRIFCTPQAYVLVLVCVLLACGLFWLFVQNLTGRTGVPRPVPEPVASLYFVGQYASLVIVISLMIIGPLLTMGSLAEEQRTGTLEMLLTTPMSEVTVVLSKFIALLTLYMLFWLPWLGYLIALRAFGEQPFDYRPLISLYIALFFLGANFIAMGLFFSSLTQDQMTAGILAFLGMMALLVLFFVMQFSDSTTVWTKIIEHTDFIILLFDSVQGKLALRKLIYHASAAVFWLILTVKSLEVRRWR